MGTLITVGFASVVVRFFAGTQKPPNPLKKVSEAGGKGLNNTFYSI